MTNAPTATRETTTPPAARPVLTCACGERFTQKRRHQVHCSPMCRKAAWAEEHPTFEQMATMGDEAFGRALTALAAERLGRGLSAPVWEAARQLDAPRDGNTGNPRDLLHLVATPEEDLRAMLADLLVHKHSGRRGRLRVRFGKASDVPMTDGVI